MICHKNNRTILVAILAIILFAPLAAARAEDAPFPGKKYDWHGFDMYKHEGTRVVVPKKAAEGKPWVWRARFWSHAPKFDIRMLEEGYHLVYCDVAGLFGAPKAVERWNGFYKRLRQQHGFAEKAVLEGMSRGGLIIYNWAAANPEKVAAIYGDAPVMDFKSWPGHKNEGIAKAYGFKDAEEALKYKGNPLDNLAPLAKAGVPIIHVVGDKDEVVPVAENTAIAQRRYKELGGLFEVIHKPEAGHKHGLEDVTPLFEFIAKHAKKDKP